MIGAVVLTALAVGATVAFAAAFRGPTPHPLPTAPAPDLVLPLATSRSSTPPGTASSAPMTVTTPPPGQRPGTIRLAAGGSARLVRREITPDGTLPIPDSLDEAAWWGVGLGAPNGAAVLSGHVNWRGRTGPFDELWRAERGQPVTIADAAGLRWTYRVTEILTLHKDELPRHAERLFNARGPHRVVLVTCGGDFVGGTDGYRDNRIVVAEPVSPQAHLN
ncbi:sortase [Crossiella sp. S99.2]|nr:MULTISPECIES: class F sortase [unclassified Crossiella]MCK2241029.1 sortase [Crossiella sp. S99.2]MCK2253827.1 sortase [Crossiella sp. S99.1]